MFIFDQMCYYLNKGLTFLHEGLQAGEEGAGGYHFVKESRAVD